MYLYFMSFLHVDMTKVVEILPMVRQELIFFYMVNIMVADALAPCVARASATMISNMLNRINSVPARSGLLRVARFYGISSAILKNVRRLAKTYSKSLLYK